MDKTLRAAGVKCYINGRNIGYVTGVQFESSTPRKAIGGIDTLTPFEIAPVAANLSGTISVIRMLGDNSLEYQGIVAGTNRVIIEKYFTLSLTMRTSAGAEYILLQANECSVSKQTWSIQARQIVTGTFSFDGIEWFNDYTKIDQGPANLSTGVGNPT